MLVDLELQHSLQYACMASLLRMLPNWSLFANTTSCRGLAMLWIFRMGSGRMVEHRIHHLQMMQGALTTLVMKNWTVCSIGQLELWQQGGRMGDNATVQAVRSPDYASRSQMQGRRRWHRNVKATRGVKTPQLGSLRCLVLTFLPQFLSNFLIFLHPKTSSTSSQPLLDSF